MREQDLNCLRLLPLLIETSSVRRTAARAGVREATVSRALKALRVMFGDHLLIKTKSGMVLTKRAEQLREPLAEWIAATDAMIALTNRDASGRAARSQHGGSDTGSDDVA